MFLTGVMWIIKSGTNTKTTFDRKHFFGTSANAVYGQIWMALIGYCLLQNLHQTLPQNNTLLDLCVRAVQTKLYDAFADLLAVLSRIPARTSRGRRPNSFSADYAQLFVFPPNFVLKALHASFSLYDKMIALFLPK